MGRWESDVARTRVPPFVGSRGMAASRSRPPLCVSPALRRRASQRIKRADIKMIFVPPPAALIVFIRVQLRELSWLPFSIINSNETSRLVSYVRDNDTVYAFDGLLWIRIVLRWEKMDKIDYIHWCLIKILFKICLNAYLEIKQWVDTVYLLLKKSEFFWTIKP